MEEPFYNKPKVMLSMIAISMAAVVATLHFDYKCKVNNARVINGIEKILGTDQCSVSTVDNRFDNLPSRYTGLDQINFKRSAEQTANRKVYEQYVLCPENDHFCKDAHIVHVGILKHKGRHDYDPGAALLGLAMMGPIGLLAGEVGDDEYKWDKPVITEAPSFTAKQKADVESLKRLVRKVNNFCFIK